MDTAPTLTLNGAQTLVRLLQAEAVPMAFGIVGGKLAPLLHALSTVGHPLHRRAPRSGGTDDGRRGLRQQRPRGAWRWARWARAG
jgi:hypothetical protein